MPVNKDTISITLTHFTVITYILKQMDLFYSHILYRLLATLAHMFVVLIETIEQTLFTWFDGFTKFIQILIAFVCNVAESRNRPFKLSSGVI